MNRDKWRSEHRHIEILESICGRYRPTLICKICGAEKFFKFNRSFSTNEWNHLVDMWLIYHAHDADWSYVELAAR